MTAFDDVLAANKTYAESFDAADVPGKAGKGLCVITCMDSRISPLEVLGLGTGDAKVLRNAGGQVTDEVLRTLVLATHVLGVDRVIVMEHTDCRMTKVTDEQVHEELLGQGLDTRSLQFGTISDQAANLRKDVQKIRSSPYLPADLAVVGCIYDVRTGVVEVAVPES